MNSEKMAVGYLIEGEIRLKTARLALSEGHFAYAIRQSQECVGLSLKGVLRLEGIEPPKWHDVGIILRNESHRFPEWFRNEIDRFSLISRELRREREPSMYGESDLNMPPDELYTKFDAQQAVDKAENVHSLCKKLQHEIWR